MLGSKTDGAYLLKHSWTHIVRHQIVKAGASTDDPALTDYWVQKRRKDELPVRSLKVKLLRMQQGRCPLCSGLLVDVDYPQSTTEWESWIYSPSQTLRIVTANVGDRAATDNKRGELVHTRCARSASVNRHSGPIHLQPHLRSLLEPDAVKVASPVLRETGAAMRQMSDVGDRDFLVMGVVTIVRRCRKGQKNSEGSHQSHLTLTGGVALPRRDDVTKVRAVAGRLRRRAGVLQCVALLHVVRDLRLHVSQCVALCRVGEASRCTTKWWLRLRDQ